MTGIFFWNAISSSSGARAPFNGMFTPNGFFVPARISSSARAKSSGRIGPAPSTPRPPAFDTATTSGALDEAQLIAAWKIGCSMPSSSVMRVFIASFLLFLVLDQLARLAGQLGQYTLENGLLAGGKAVAQRRVTLGRRADQPAVELAPALAQAQVHAAAVLVVRVAHDELASRQSGDH